MCLLFAVLFIAARLFFRVRFRNDHREQDFKDQHFRVRTRANLFRHFNYYQTRASSLCVFLFRVQRILRREKGSQETRGCRRVVIRFLIFERVVTCNTMRGDFHGEGLFHFRRDWRVVFVRIKGKRGVFFFYVFTSGYGRVVRLSNLSGGSLALPVRGVFLRVCNGNLDRARVLRHFKGNGARLLARIGRVVSHHANHRGGDHVVRGEGFLLSRLLE